MRSRTLCSYLALVTAILAITAASASAGAWIKWGNGPQIQLTKVQIPVTERQSPLEQYVWQLGSDWYSGYEFALDANYPGHIAATGGGDSFVDQYGQPIYVRIGQAVKNNGTASWNDLHIRTGNGGVPYKIYGSWWPSDWSINNIADGWDFVRDPDGMTQVMPGEILYDEIWLRVDPAANTFSIEKWATVPEPGAFVSLATGLVALCAGIRRRNRR